MSTIPTEFPSSSNRRFAEITGIRMQFAVKTGKMLQPVIVHLEKGQTDPQLTTIMKILAPLGKTIVILPLVSLFF